MAPVHADIVERAGGAITSELLQDRGQEAGELGGGHLPRGHHKLAMAVPSFAEDMTDNRDVVRRVGEDDLRHSFLHQPVICGWIERITAEKPMWAKLP